MSSFLALLTSITFLIMVGGGIGRQKGIKWCQLAYHQLMSQQGPHFITAKMIKAHSSGRMVSSGKSDVVIASVYSEKACVKKLMIMMMKMIIIIMKKMQETMFFSIRRKLTFTMKLRPEK